MAAPNIRNPSIITGKTDVNPNISTSATTILTNTSNSGKVFKINSIFAANTNGSVSSTISISISDGGTDTYLAKTIIVPADATQIISTKETYFYLEEGWSIKAQAGNTFSIDVIISYEEISNV